MKNEIRITYHALLINGKDVWYNIWATAADIARLDAHRIAWQKL